MAVIFILPTLCTVLGLDVGAFIGSFEFADAAAEIAVVASLNDDRAIAAFTTMKIIGRDVFIGVWSVGLILVYLKYWEKDTPTNLQGSKLQIIWQKFPNFVFAFIIASIFTSIMSIIVSDVSSYQNEIISTLKNLRNWVLSLCF